MTWHTVKDGSADLPGGGQRFWRAAVLRAPDGAVQLAWPGAQATLEPERAARAEARATAASGQTSTGPKAPADGQAITLRAPMAAQVLAVPAVVGAEAENGSTLVVLEAMKMEHALVAPHGARVAAVHVTTGDQVHKGQPLVTLAAAAGAR